MSIKSTSLKSTAVVLTALAIGAGALSATTASAKTSKGFHSGKATLQRLLRPHTYFIPVSRAAREATGNPKIQVIDRRVGYGSFQCSFITHTGKRTLICD